MIEILMSWPGYLCYRPTVCQSLCMLIRRYYSHIHIDLDDLVLVRTL